MSKPYADDIAVIAEDVEKSKKNIDWNWESSMIKGSENKWAEDEVYRNYKEGRQKITRA